MKIPIKAVTLMLVLMIMLMPAVACGKPTPPPPLSPPAPTLKKITLADAPMMLDLSPLLPASYERLDAASEGMSNEDMELGPDFSQVELFLSEEPYQTIFAYLTIIESRLERASSDALLKDEEQIKSMVIENLKAGAAQEGVELAGATVEVTHPDIGDLAILGSGTMSAYSFSIGYDMLVFKNNKVYVFIMAVYLPGKNLSLVPLAREIDHRIGMFSQ